MKCPSAPGAAAFGAPEQAVSNPAARVYKGDLEAFGKKEEFPYAIRQVSEALGSNGSTSMGSVCASTLSLLNAGVPLRAPVAGIAMGLMHESDDEYKILTDIQGPEDHHGDMDFKIAGSHQGITGIQLDLKNHGISQEIVRNTLAPYIDQGWKILYKQDVSTVAELDSLLLEQHGTASSNVTTIMTKEERRAVTSEAVRSASTPVATRA